MNRGNWTSRGASIPLSGRLIGVVVVFLAGLHVGLSVAPAAGAGPGTEPFRIGFTRSIFMNQNENDILAAMSVWADTISREREVDVDSDMLIFESVDLAANAVQQRSLDAVTLLLEEYASFPEGLLSGPCFRDMVQDSTHVEFVLLGRKVGGVTRLEDLRGAKLIAHDEQGMELAMQWLNAELESSTLGSIGEVVASLERKAKLSSAVLSVFFGKNDACLVTREGFDSMVELNPQLSNELGVVAVSPAIVPSIFCFRSDLPQTRKVELFDQVLRLDESVTGRQVLQVFKSDGMAAVSDDEIDRSIALMNGWRTTAPAASGQGPGRGER